MLNFVHVVVPRPRSGNHERLQAAAEGAPEVPFVWRTGGGEDRDEIGAYPRPERFWLLSTLVTTLVLGACVRSTMVDALPGVNMALRHKLAPAAVLTETLMYGGVRTVVSRSTPQRRTVGGLLSLSSSFWKTPRREIGVVSTLSPILSDLRLDPFRLGKQKYRQLTYALVHASLPHLAFDAWSARRALVPPEKTPTYQVLARNDTYACATTFFDVAFLYSFGVWAGAQNFLLAPYAKGTSSVDVQFPVGGAAGIAALLGNRVISRLRLKQTKRGDVAGAAFVDLVLQLVGNVAFGTPPALTLGGFAAGLLYGHFNGHKFVAKEKDDDSTFLLMGDARDRNRLNKKPRKLARRIGNVVTLYRKDPIFPQPGPLLFLVLATRGDLLQAILQTPNALRISFFKNPRGLLSDRLLQLPPQFPRFP
mmetsp:Transcript_27215/g.87954  ORF Transcript_27215/g.87954 Transcript_27215/m.87954 type:complete len:421 (-) Transcript_27215:89-1351(-)